MTAAKVVHFEIPADDMNRAKNFYSSVFDWQMEDYPEMKYIGARTVEMDMEKHMPKEPGAINGGIMERSPEVSAPVIAMNVPSVDESIKKVEAAGGKVVKAKTDIGGMGFYAYVKDTEGNVIGLWEDLKK